ncbi:hypothetical protein [uncultured Prevotella sp.]|jgi:hypothetical protein|nr:hypothetical protein [uncultured Prevotella sp.]
MSNNQSQMTGAYGEALVVTELVKRGYVALNANAAVRNHRAIDIVCIKYDDATWAHKSVLIQVKTRRGRDFSTGFNLSESINIDLLNKEVKGPYVFIYLKDENSPEYYILSRKQLIKLLSGLHIAYCKNITGNTSRMNSEPAMLSLRFIQGENGKKGTRLDGYINPFPGNIFHNAWDNIWKE